MKWHGIIGFMESVETSRGIWEEKIVDRPYYGEVLRLNRRYDNGNTAIDNLSISNQISILSDPYANLNFIKMKYIKYLGNKWEISDITVQYPRLILTLGGLYNEEGLDNNLEDEEDG